MFGLCSLLEAQEGCRSGPYPQETPIRCLNTDKKRRQTSIQKQYQETKGLCVCDFLTDFHT